MNSTSRGWAARLAATLGVVALSALTLVPTAQAADPTGNIDFGRTGSIIIHKSEQGGTGTGTPNGSQAPTANAVPGVVFTAYPITSLDLSVAASWNTLASLTVPSTACDVPSLAGQTLGTGIASAPTDANGLTTLSGRQVAAYLVCETSAPSTVVDKALPFVVTIPYPYQNDWLYNVNVYPKNGLATVTKSITAQTGLGLGSTVTFPVTSDIAKIDPSNNFAYYRVTDPMATELTSPAVASVALNDGGTITTVPSTYYTVSVNGQTAKVEFTSTGLAWLKTQGGKKIVTTFTGVVSTLPANGTISNTATLYANTRAAETPGTTSDAVTTHWGDLAITKHDAQARPLQGATFEVYPAAQPYAATCSATVDTGATPISVSGATTFTSAASGNVTIPGLFVSDSVNAPINSAYRCYVIKEVAAPAGYVLPADAAAFTAVRVTAGQSTAADVTVTNTQQGVPQLPFTGAGSQVLMISVGGGLLLLAGVGAILVRRRHRGTAE